METPKYVSIQGGGAAECLEIERSQVSKVEFESAVVKEMPSELLGLSREGWRRANSNSLDQSMASFHFLEGEGGPGGAERNMVSCFQEGEGGITRARIEIFPKS